MERAQQYDQFLILTSSLILHASWVTTLACLGLGGWAIAMYSSGVENTDTCKIQTIHTLLFTFGAVSIALGTLACVILLIFTILSCALRKPQVWIFSLVKSIIDMIVVIASAAIALPITILTFTPYCVRFRKYYSQAAKADDRIRYHVRLYCINRINIDHFIHLHNLVHNCCVDNRSKATKISTRTERERHYSQKEDIGGTSPRPRL